jgi:hypothetical protein
MREGGWTFFDIVILLKTELSPLVDRAHADGAD